MKCRRVEKLIPLYVEGDLAVGVSERIASHLDWCGRCNWMVDEYKESQSWLRLSDTPEFDEEALNALKAGVLSRIAETSAKPSLLANLMQHWSRRQVLALSAAMLIIFGVVVLYIYQARMGAKPRVEETAREVPETVSPVLDKDRRISNPKTATPGGLDKHRHPNVKANVKPQAGTPVLLDQTFEPPLVSQTNPLQQSETGSVEPTGEFPDSRDVLPEMLRIEIQTSDPTIRIIWFAPKEVEGPKTNQ